MLGSATAPGRPGARAGARRRQVAEAVGSSSHLTPRWREMDSNLRFLVASPSEGDGT